MLQSYEFIAQLLGAGEDVGRGSGNFSFAAACGAEAVIRVDFSVEGYDGPVGFGDVYGHRLGIAVEYQFDFFPAVAVGVVL